MTLQHPPQVRSDYQGKVSLNEAGIQFFTQGKCVPRRKYTERDGRTGAVAIPRWAHKWIWVEPTLLAEIEYRAKSAEGKVRHPFFKGLREDL
jgi:ATP-dependent DNA ligase